MAQRKMIAHYYGGSSDAVDGWRCTNCHWSYDTEQPYGEYDVPYDILQHAKEKFGEHICAEHP